jgi:site-specific DNA recombinase
MVYKRAAIYIRVSTDKQEENGTSLETQEAKCLEYCTTHKYRVSQKHIYRDVWTGTEYLERPELTRLREDARNGLFDIVVIYAFDRLARKQVHQAVIIEDLRRCEINIESVTENFDDSAVGQFLRNAAAFAAELEHEKIRERTQRGRLQKLRNGKLLVQTYDTFSGRNK